MGVVGLDEDPHGGKVGDVGEKERVVAAVVDFHRHHYPAVLTPFAPGAPFLADRIDALATVLLGMLT